MKNSKKRIIEVIPYNIAWKESFAKEALVLKSIFKTLIKDIQHIGSTAIPGMHAKPIIDILVSVSDIRKIDSFNKKMQVKGYIAKGEFGIAGRRFFIKENEIFRTHHIHIFQQENPEIKRHINFRDYLIKHKNSAKKYSKLKRELAWKYKNDIKAYIAGKDKFIKDIDRKAAILFKETR